MTRVLIFRDGRPVDTTELEEVDPPRDVRAFVSLDPCVRDVDVRGNCVKFDLHGLWWSVPMEFNIHQIDAAIRAELHRLDCRPLPYHLGDVYRPTVA